MFWSGLNSGRVVQLASSDAFVSFVQIASAEQVRMTCNNIHTICICTTHLQWTHNMRSMHVQHTHNIRSIDVQNTHNIYALYRRTAHAQHRLYKRTTHVQHTLYTYIQNTFSTRTIQHFLVFFPFVLLLLYFFFRNSFIDSFMNPFQFILIIYWYFTFHCS